ncbi:MAG: universal stress protein [Calothrix sp. MO_167.B42]|nr:universal stress protein [Calothrix sp. MO_167.B42]
MFKKILVAIDSSDISQLILAEAESLAKAMDANVMLLYVQASFNEQYLNPILLQPDGFYSNFHTEAVAKYMKQWEEVKQEKIEWLRSLSEKISNHGIKTEFTLNFGDPSRMICELAKSWDADLIMLGRRGMSGLSEMFLGSVSNYVLHHAPCSVLTIQGPGVTNSTELPQQEEFEPV